MFSLFYYCSIMFNSNTNRLRILLFLLAAGIHGALICFISFSVTTKTSPSSEPAVKTIQLVNIQEEVPPPPPPPQPKPQVQRTSPPIPQHTPEPVAETFIETTELPPPEHEPAEVAPALVSPAAAPNPGKQEEEAALKNAYIKKNFNYIQRRIRDKLVYPSQARRAGIQGLTEVVFTIHQDGSVSGVSVRVSSGQAMLDQAALDAIYAAAPFRPPPPAAAKIAVPVAFKLR
jgi:protein TonB